MVLFGDIFDEVVFAMRAKNNADEQARARRKLNEDYQAIAHEDSWAEMRDIEELTWTGDAVQLPANLFGIDLVWDDDYEIEFLPRNRSASEHDETAFRYYTYPVGTSLVEVDDGRINQDGTTLNSSELTASGETIVGEFFYVEGMVQLYEVTAVVGDNYTFTPAYRGMGNSSGAKVVVRPSTTKMLQITAPANHELPTGTITLHYWKQPPYLRDPSDIVLLPMGDVLTLTTLGQMSEARKHRPISQSQVDRALQKALAQNPDKPQPRVLRGIHGRKIDFSENHYADRRTVGLRQNRIYDTWQTNRN
jgi:hypothetical protein